MLSVLSFCPLPLGKLAFRDPEPKWMLVAKATYALGPGRLALASTQEPLTLRDEAAALEPDEIVSACDFTLPKASVDVLLKGLGRSRAETQAIAIRLAIGSIDKRGFLLADSPTKELPIRASNTRTLPDSRGKPMRFGPARAPLSPEEATQSAGPFPQASAWNVAPADQQLKRLPERATLLLEGLLPPSGGLLACELPGQKPRLFLATDAVSQSAEEIPLSCDTLTVDTEKRLVTLLFRGVCQPKPDAYLVLALDDGKASTSWEALRPRLAQAAWSLAQEPFAVEDEHTEDLDPPTERKPAREPQPSQRLLDADDDGTETVFQPNAPPARALPFDTPFRGASVPAERAPSRPGKARLDALPFVRAQTNDDDLEEEPTADLAASEIETIDADAINAIDATDDEGTITAHGPDAPARDVPAFWRELQKAPEPARASQPGSLQGLPFQAPAPPPVPISAPPAAPLPIATPAPLPIATPAPLPILAAAPPIATPEPLPMRLALSLDDSVIQRHARVRAELLRRGNPVSPIEPLLAELGIEEELYFSGEELLEQALSTEARAGKTDLFRKVRIAVARARKTRGHDLPNAV